MTPPPDNGAQSPGIAPAITNVSGGFQGTWSAPAGHHSGTYFRFGDLDNGESFTLRAATSS